MNATRPSCHVQRVKPITYVISEGQLAELPQTTARFVTPFENGVHSRIGVGFSTMPTVASFNT
jgi:hypothetical protein